MKNDDRKKYLKRLKIQNVLLLIIIIIGAIILAYRISNHVQDSIFRKSEYYRHRSYFFSILAGQPTSEIEAFNSMFTFYGGKQTGSKLKEMLRKLIDNAKSYKDDARKIPKVEYTGKDNIMIYSDNRTRLTVYEEKKSNIFERLFYKYNYKEFDRILKNEEEENRISEEFINNNGVDSYIEVLADISSKLNGKTTYNVEFTYKWDCSIDTIIINEL